MATIFDVFNNVKKVDLYKLATKVVRKNSEPILNLNKKQLFGKGENSLGEKLKRYSERGTFYIDGRFVSYPEYKHNRNPSPGYGNPDLYNTGAFYKGFRLKILSNKEFEMNSKDGKTKDLEKKYGADIFGIGVLSQNEMIERFFHNDLINEVKTVAQL